MDDGRASASVICGAVGLMLTASGGSIWVAAAGLGLLAVCALLVRREGWRWE